MRREERRAAGTRFLPVRGSTPWWERQSFVWMKRFARAVEAVEAVEAQGELPLQGDQLAEEEVEQARGQAARPKRSKKKKKAGLAAAAAAEPGEASPAAAPAPPPATAPDGSVSVD